MLLRYGKHINYLATTFLLVTFFGFLLSVTSLSHYSTPTTFTLLKASFWTTVILTIIGFGREKKRTYGYTIWHLYTCSHWSLHFFHYRLPLSPKTIEKSYLFIR